MTAEELDKRFPSHPLPRPTDLQAEKAKLVREHFRTMAETIDEIVPDGRLKSMALTSLEESSTWAVKAVFS